MADRTPVDRAVTAYGAAMAAEQKAKDAAIIADLRARIAALEAAAPTPTPTPTPIPTPANLDTFGIRKMYPDRLNGMKWEANWASPRTFTGVDPQDPWFDANHGDASYRVQDGQLFISGAVPRMYIHDPSRVRQWTGGIEMTTYFMRVSDTSPAWAGCTSVARSNHGTTGSETANLCDTRGIAARTRIDGHIDFEKETSHPYSVPVADKPLFTGGLPRGRWIGHKFVVYDLPSGYVKLEHYLDEGEGANGGAWRKVNEFTDDGTNMGVNGRACALGIDPRLPLRGGTSRDGSESGKPNISCYFRSDGVAKDGLVYRATSVREVTVP